MAMINIDGIDLPGPSSYSIPNFDLDSEDSVRNELGYFQRDRIREGIFIVELGFIVNSSDLALIKSAIKPAEFQATILTEIGFVTKTMMAEDRDIGMVKYNEVTDDIVWNISFNLIEY